jgi:hypothetical protein
MMQGQEVRAVCLRRGDGTGQTRLVFGAAVSEEQQWQRRMPASSPARAEAGEGTGRIHPHATCHGMLSFVLFYRRRAGARPQ